MPDFQRLGNNLAGRRQGFEELIQAIAMEVDNAQAVDGAGGDTGLDAFVGRIGDDIRVYQAKYYEGRLLDSRKRQIKGSLRTARTNHPNMRKWVLAISITFTPSEHSWWQELVEENSDIEIDLWDEGKIDNLLNKPECRGIREARLPNISDEIQNASTQRTEEHREIRLEIQEEGQQVRNVMQGVRTDQQEIMRYLRENLPVDEESREAARVQELNRQLDQAKSFFQNNKPQTAFTIYQDLLNQIQTSNHHILFRIHSGLGSCYLELGQLENALNHFEEANRCESDNPKGLANLAFVRFLSNRYDDGAPYIEEAYRIDPTEPHVLSIYTMLLVHRGEFQNAINLFNDDLLQNEICMFALAKVYESAGDFNNAQEWYSRSLESESTSAEKYLEFSSFLYSPVLDKLNSGVILAHQISNEERDTLYKADEYLTSAIEILEDSEKKKLRGFAFTNRSVVRMALEKLNEALVDTNEAVEIDGDNEQAWINKGMISLKLGNFAEAEIAFSAANRLNPDQARIQQKIAETYSLQGKYDEAISVIREVIPEGTEENIDDSGFDLAITLAQTYLSNNQTSEAETLTESLNNTFPNNPDVLLLLGSISLRKGELDNAENFYLDALNHSDEQRRPQVNLELADFYYKQKNYEKSLTFYARIINLQSNNSLLKRYLTCLFNLGRFGECRTVASDLRRQGLADVSVIEFEAAALDNLDRLSEAGELYHTLFEIQPDETRHLVNEGSCLFRQGDIDGSRGLFDQALEQGIERAIDKIAIAQIYAEMDLSWEAIDLAYDALQMDFDNPQIHLAYVHVFLKRSAEIDQQLNVERVEAGVVVTFQRENHQPRTYTIIPQDEPPRGRDEISISTPLAQALLGHSKDDEIEIPSGNNSSEVIKILDLKSKYVHAFQNSLSEYQSRFLGEPGLQQFSVGEGNFDEIFRRLDNLAERTDEIISEYKRLNLPISCFAKMLNRNLLVTWAGLTAIPDLNVLSAMGTVEEQQQEVELISQSDAVVVDLIALFTLRILDCFDLLPRIFDTIYVQQATLDELNQIIMEEAGQGEARMVLSRQGNRYVREEVSQEAIQNRLESLNELKDFIINECEVVGLENEQDVIPADIEDFVGLSATKAIALAKENEIPLYSDDLSLRQLARQQGVAGFWTQNLLRRAVEKEVLSRNSYSKHTVQLLELQYTFVSVQAPDIMNTLSANGFDIDNSSVKVVIESLMPQTVREESVLAILSDIVKWLWLEPITLQRREAVLHSMMDILCAERDTATMVRKFRSLIDLKFRLLPLQRNEVIQQIDIWFSQQIS